MTETKAMDDKEDMENAEPEKNEECAIEKTDICNIENVAKTEITLTKMQVEETTEQTKTENCEISNPEISNPPIENNNSEEELEEEMLESEKENSISALSEVEIKEKTESITSKTDQSKPKWKLKIRVSGKANTNEKHNQKWEVISSNIDTGVQQVVADNETSKESSSSTSQVQDMDVDVETVADSGSATMVKLLTSKTLSSKRKIKRKSYDSGTYSTTIPTQKKAKGGIRHDCPPFCKTSCTYAHHPLLVCARRMIENDSSSTLAFLDSVSDYYGGSSGNMKPSDSIADPWKNTEFPLLHYIALMGKCAGCFAMIDAGHEPELVVTSAGNTVLHTIIKEMYVFNCTHGHMDILLKKFNLLLREFKSCLLVTNKSGKTPLHLCAFLISKTSKLLSPATGRSKPPFRLYQFQKNMFMSLIEQFQMDQVESSMINTKDNDHNTISHFLANDRASHELLDQLKDMGADFDICNNAGISVKQAMLDAPPPPSSDMLEMAAFSAKGQKYKTSHRKPAVSLPKPLKVNKSVTPTKKVETPQKVVAKCLPPASTDTPLSQQILQKAGRARVKITPTRKEKLDKKNAKSVALALSKIDKDAKENLNSLSRQPVTVLNIEPSLIKALPASSLSLPQSIIISSNKNTKTILPKGLLINNTILAKPVLIASTAPNNNANAASITRVTPIVTLPSQSTGIRKSESGRIMLPNSSTNQLSSTSQVAKVKPLSMATSVDLPTMAPTIQSKLEISPSMLRPQTAQIFPTFLNPTVSQVRQLMANKMTEKQNQPINLTQKQSNLSVRVSPQPQPNSNMMSPTMLNQNQPSSNGPKTVAMDKPMLFQTADGKIVQLNVATVSQPNQPIHNISPNSNFQPGQNSLRNKNMQNYQQFRMPNFQNQNMGVRMMAPGVRPSMQVHPGMMAPPRPININGQWVVPMTTNGNGALYPPQMRYQHPQQQMNSPQPMPSPPMHHNISPPGVSQANVFFSPRQVLRPSNILAPAAPHQYHNFPVTRPMRHPTDGNMKRGRKLEASIKNLQNISMDIIKNSPLSSPTQKSPTIPLPTEETAPPVYIIDAEDEKNIYSQQEVKVGDTSHKNCITSFMKSFLQEKGSYSDFVKFTQEKRQTLIRTLENEKHKMQGVNEEIFRKETNVQHLTNLLSVKEKEIQKLTSQLRDQNISLNELRNNKTNLIDSCTNHSKRIKQLEVQVVSFESALATGRTDM